MTTTRLGWLLTPIRGKEKRRMIFFIMARSDRTSWI